FEAIALVQLSVKDNSAAIVLAFLGCSTLLQGSLIYRAVFLPRWLGVIGMIGGFGWLTFLYPPLGVRLFLYLALFAMVGVLATSLWLLTVGVDEQRWRERAAQAAASIWT